MASSVERRRALHAATRVHELTAEVAARSDARGGGGAAGGSRFSERERRLLERAAAAGPAPEVSALQSQQHGMEPEPSAAADLLPLENELQQEPVAMQRVGLTPCHVVRDYGYDDSVTAHEQISFSGTHTVTVGHLPLRRGELVMVTALSVEGSMLHGYVHEAANTIGDVTSGHRGRAGIFPRDSVIQLLDVPDEARVSRSWPGTGQNAELHLVNGDRITVTAKGGLCSSPGDAGTEAIWYGYCHRTGVAGFFPAECVDIPTDSELVIEVVGATRLPLINAETADPTVRMTLVDSHGRPKGRQRRSQPKKNSANPVWHCYRDFGVHASPTDRVVIEVFDNAESHFVGSVWMRVDELPLIPSAVGLSRNATVLPDGGDRGDGGGGQLVAARSGLDLQIELAERNHRQPQLQPLSLETATRAASEPMLTLRRVPNLRAGAHKRMRMIFIRHGESQWNAGQAESHQVRLHALGGLWKMFSQTDHPLSETGVAQASTANRNWQKQHLAMKGGLKALSTSQDDWVRAFLNAGRVYSSPLTRAVETCLLSLRGHPTLKQRGVSLISSAREVKNLGGQDTVGCAVGEGITARVQEELSVMIGEEEAAAILTEHGSIDAFDASTGALPQHSASCKVS